MREVKTPGKTMTAVLLKPFRGRWIALIPLELAMAFIALTKFSHFVIATLCIAAIGVTLGTQERWRRAALAVSPFVVFIVGLWLAAGQRLAHIPAYISSSLEIGVELRTIRPLTAHHSLPEDSSRPDD